MSVANQANEKLTQLVSLTKQIESYLNPNGSKKGDQANKDNQNKKTVTTNQGPSKGPSIDSAKEAMAIGGMATSIAKLIVATNLLSSKAGVKVKDFLVNFSEGLRDASNNIKSVNGVELIEAMSKMSRSIFAFALGMTAIAVLAPLVAIGTLVFMLAIKGILMALSTADKNVGRGASALATLMGIGRGIALFALTMVGIGLVAPLFALGTLVFILAITAILMALKIADARAGKGASALTALMSMGKGIALFALTMVGIALVAPLFALGTLVFILAITAILMVLKTATAATTRGSNSIVALMKISKGVMLFALTMVAIGYFVDKFALGTIAFVLAITAIMFVLKEVGKNSLLINRGIKSLKTMVLPLALFGLTMAIAGFVYDKIALGALALGLSIGFIMLVVREVGKNMVAINKGIKSLNTMVKPLALFGIVVAVAGFVYKEILKGSAALAFGIGVIGLAAYGVGQFDKDIKKGAIVLDLLIAPMIGFAVGLAIVGSLVKDDPKTLALKMLVLGGAIVGLGLAAYVLGNPAVALFAEIGAGVLITLAASLVVFAGALYLLSKADFTKEKTDNLSYAIAEIGFALAKFGLVAIPAAIGAAVLIPASLALLPLTGALAIFKTVGWTQEDGEGLVNALTSTVQGFAHALDGVGMLGMVKLLAAIPIIALIGGALVSLAVGVKSMATLSFTEMEYDKKTHKLVPKRVVKLTDAEIQAVGPNTAKILNALAMPLTNFGMWSTMGETGFGPFTIGSGYMMKGIRAAAEIGSAISSIAEGVANMANLTVVDYEVRKGKLVPTKVRKLKDSDFTAAATNTSAILNALVMPLTAFGMWSTIGEGAIFGDGYTVKGIEAAGKVGNAIASIAKGVADMATLNVVEYEVRNGKLVPISTRKLNNGDFTLAAKNVALILKTLTKPLTDFGRSYKSGSSWFTDSALEAGIEAAGKITDPISKMADMVLKLAGGQATINEVINPGTKNAKLVAKGTINFADAVPMAIANAKKLLYAFPQVFATLGVYIDKYEDEIDTAIEFMPKMSKAAKQILSVSESYLNITKNIAESSKNGKNIDGVLTGFATSLSQMGSSFDKMDNNKITMYKKFASITEGMTKINTPFEKFAKTFGQFTKEMGSFVKIWDKFGKDDATNLKTYADALKTIASVDAGKLTATTKALKEQAQAQADLNNAKKNSAAPTDTKDDNKNTPSKENTKNTTAANTNDSTNKGDNSKASSKPQNASSLDGKVIARLEVTNLYINGKIQQ